MLHKLTWSIALLITLVVSPFSQASAATNTVGRIMFTYGPAWIQQGSDLTKIKKGDTVAAHYFIVTGPRARVKIRMGDGSNIYIGSKSKVSLQQYEMSGKSLISGTIGMLWGKARFFVNKLTNSGASFRVRTPTAVLGVRGTEFMVSVPPTLALLSRAFDLHQLSDMPPLPTRAVLMEGAIDVDNGLGNSTRLSPGQTADVNSKKRITVRKTESDDMDQHRNTSSQKGKTQKSSGENKGGSGGSPEKPKPSDADPIMNSGNDDDDDDRDDGAANPPPFSPPPPNPSPSTGTGQGGTPPENPASGQTGAVSNAKQNLGISDIKIQPSFVKP